jgi:hypothetical protein
MESIVSVSLFVLAAICNAVMDISSHHFSESALRSFNPMWWNAEVSWKNKYVDGDPKLGRRKIWRKINYPVQLTDAWHFFKTLMIVLLALSVLSFSGEITGYFIVDLLIYGFAWNLPFNLFYNRILRRPG